MKPIDLTAALTSSYRGCVSLERSFVLLMVTAGVFIFFMASMLVQQSHSDMLRQYLAAKRAYMGRQAQEMAETEHVITSLAHSNGSGLSTQTPPLAPAPLTADPPWMNATATPVKPYLPGPRKHPFIGGYILDNPGLCLNSTVDLLIVIHSAVDHAQRRRILRETWAGVEVLQGVEVRTVFVLGRGKDKEGQVGVNTEQATYGDIVQGDFLDTFPNLTRKAVTALRWVNDRCLHARFVLKTDDDVFVNVFSLAEQFLQLLWGRRRAVLCHAKAANTSRIERKPKSKWFVPPALLPALSHWPAFCSGYVVVMTPDVVPALYEASFRAPYVPVDDGFVYGVLPLLAWRQGAQTQSQAQTAAQAQTQARVQAQAQTQAQAHTQARTLQQQHQATQTQTSPDHGLHFLDMSRNLTLSTRTLLPHYLDTATPLRYVGGAVGDDVSLQKLWQAVQQRLTPWARHRARLTRLRGSMPSTFL